MWILEKIESVLQEMKVIQVILEPGKGVSYKYIGPKEDEDISSPDVPS
jgi:hypothetical protein